MTFLLAQAWIGTVPGWLTILGIAMLAWYVRGGAGGQSIEILREQRDVLAARVTELENDNTRLHKRVVELEAKTDVTLAIAPAISPVLDALHMHEANAEKRLEAKLAVLDMIAARLGPDKEGKTT